MNLILLAISVFILSGCSLVKSEKLIVKKDLSIETAKPKWLTNPSYNGKLAAIGTAGYTMNDANQEKIAINKALIKLAELSGSDININKNITLLRNSDKQREIYNSNTSASIVSFKNIKALITHKFKDKDGYLHIRLEKIN